MKTRKKYLSGFVLKKATCSMCDFKAQDVGDFYQLKDELVADVQTLHEKTKAMLCDGKLTIVFNQAVREV